MPCTARHRQWSSQCRSHITCEASECVAVRDAADAVPCRVLSYMAGLLVEAAHSHCVVWCRVVLLFVCLLLFTLQV